MMDAIDQSLAEHVHLHEIAYALKLMFEDERREWQTKMMNTVRNQVIEPKHASIQKGSFTQVGPTPSASRESLWINPHPLNTRDASAMDDEALRVRGNNHLSYRSPQAQQAQWMSPSPATGNIDAAKGMTIAKANEQVPNDVRHASSTNPIYALDEDEDNRLAAGSQTGTGGSTDESNGRLLHGSERKRKRFRSFLTPVKIAKEN
jgi:hypothetical protein